MYVYAAITGSVSWNGTVVRLVEGEVWPAADPFVKQRDDLFRSTPPVVRNTEGRPTIQRERPIERATRAPGEKRRGSVR